MKYHVRSDKNHTISILSKQNIFNCKILEQYQGRIFETECPKIQITYYPKDFRLFFSYNLTPNSQDNPTHQILLNAKDIHNLKVLNQIGNLWEIRTDKVGNIFRIEIDSHSINFVQFPDYSNNLFEMNIMMGSFTDVVSISFMYDRE